jgi:hypothetical protein
MFAYLFLAVLVMAPFFGDLFTVGRRRNSTDRLPSPQARQHSGGGLSSRPVGLCEVSGHDHLFRPSLPPLTLLVGDLCLTKPRSAGNDRSSSRIQVSSTHTAGELAREPVRRRAATLLVPLPASQRSADTADLHTPGNLSFSPLYFPHR